MHFLVSRREYSKKNVQIFSVPAAKDLLFVWLRSFEAKHKPNNYLPNKF
jgi:hypothetical protein